MYNSTPTKSNTEKAVKLAELKNGTPVCRIEFPYNQEDLNRVRGLRERKYYPEGKYWTCPVDVPSLELLAEWGFKLDSNLQAILDRSKVSITDVKEIKIPGLKGTLRPFQNIGVSFIDAKNGRCLIADEMGLGKAQPWYTKVLTPSGWKQIGNLSLKDQVFGSDGISHKLKGIYNKGNKKVYKVTFSDKTSVECCEDHLWTIYSPRDKWMGFPSKTFPLKEIMKMQLKSDKKSKANLVFIPMLSDAIDFPERKLIIPPYTMGALLGDGGISKGVCFSNTDSDIIERVGNELLPLGYTLKKDKGENCDFHVVHTNPKDKSKINEIKNIIRKYRLNVTSEYKYIPDDYKFGSIEQRAELLRGLLDTDGYASLKSGVIQFTSVSEQLCDDVVFLVESFGGIARKKSYPGIQVCPNGDKKIGKIAHSLTIMMPKGNNPFFCIRKRTSCKEKVKYSPARAITKIEYVKTDLCFCISVDTKDHLYVTEHCILTHNTVQALAYLQLHKELRTAIIVVPASLKLNWLRETFNWIPNSQAEVLTGRTPYKTTGKILILNYDILEAWVPYLIKIKPKILIMDEVHCIKNGAAKRTKAAKKLGKVVEHIIGLSGTPVLNRPIEIYNAVSMIDPTVLGSYFVFTKRYCDAKKSIWGTNVQGASNVEELHRKLTSTVMLRRLKVNVAKDLPDKQTAFVPIELDNWAEYVYAERNFIKWVSETKGTAAAIRASNAETLGQINALKQLAVKGKMANVISWIEEFIDSGEKLVLFCTHTATIDAIMTAFPKISVRYDGGVNQSNRDKAVTSFQTDVRIKLFVGMLDAAGNPAGVGLTLTAAWSTATIEYQYTPGVHDQADDRIHRIGQKNACTNYKLIAAGTIEEKIAALLDKKRQIVDGILDGKRTPAESLLMELIKSYQK